MKHLPFSILILNLAIASTPITANFVARDAIAAEAAAQPGFWCGTSDRELEMKMTNPAAKSDIVVLTDPSAGPDSQVLATLPGAAITPSNTGLLYQAQTRGISLQADRYIGPVSLSQIRSVQIFVNANSSDNLSTNPAYPLFEGWISIENQNGQSSRSAVTCVPYELAI